LDSQKEYENQDIVDNGRYVSLKIIEEGFLNPVD